MADNSFPLVVSLSNHERIRGACHSPFDRLRANGITMLSVIYPILKKTENRENRGQTPFFPQKKVGNR